MNRSTLVPVVIASLAFVLGAFLLARAVRYEVVPAEEGHNVAWLVDRATGNVVRLVDTVRKPVREKETSGPEETSGDELADEALRTAQGYEFTLNGDHHRLYWYINKWLGQARGPVEVEGWHVKKVGEGKYLVTFAFTNGGHRYGWAIEAMDCRTGRWVLRDALADPELRKLYGLENLEPPPPLAKR